MGTTLQALQLAAHPAGQVGNAVLRQQVTQDFYQILQEAQRRHRKEIVSIGTVGALLVGGLVLLAGTGVLPAQLITPAALYWCCWRERVCCCPNSYAVCC